MATERRRTIEGEADRARDADAEAAQAAGRLIGEWIRQVLARAAAETWHPRPPTTVREEVAELLDVRLRPIEETLGRIAKRVAALEEQAGRETRPEPAGGMTAAPASVEAEEIDERPKAAPTHTRAQLQKRRGPPRRELPEPVRARIDELHRAGRSMNAISKEVGVPYHVVYAYVKSLGKRA